MRMIFLSSSLIFSFFPTIKYRVCVQNLRMPNRKALRAGVGAECSVLLSRLHPSKLIDDHFTNRSACDRLDGLIALKRELKYVNRRDQYCIVFRHERLHNQQIHCVERYCKVTKEGSFVDLFNKTDIQSDVPEESVLEADGEVDQVQDQLLHLQGTDEDVEMVIGMGFDVDDDDMPAPENVPTAEQQRKARADTLYEGQSWGWDGFCERKKLNFCQNKPFLRVISDMVVLSNMTYLGMFLIFFPRLLVDLIVIETSKNMLEKGIASLTYGEFLVYIGLRLFMSTLIGYKTNDFWSSASITMESGAPFRLNEFMSKKRFDNITQCLTFTNQKRPSYIDKFWEVRQMISLWNENMAAVFSPGWVTCLDESMSIWFNRWTCPGWVYCPRKPHPFGNEYHDICCGLSNILFRILLVEGKDKPQNKPPSEFERYGPTTHLLLECCRTIFHTGRVVILDSGFCVLKAIVKLREYGVFASAVIKKRRYWPSLVKGDVIEKYMNEENKKIGDGDAIQGTLNGSKYNIFCFKDSTFIMKLMSTYGTLRVPDDQADTHRRLSDGTKISFKYTECFANHYKFRHAVDDHNHLRHKLPSIEDSWITHRWPVRVFSFILSISEINAFLAFRYFIWEKELQPHLTLLQFRRKLALQLIMNDDWVRDQEERGIQIEEQQRRKRQKHQKEHLLLTAPHHASFFANEKWTCTAKTKYPQYACKGAGCKNRIRTYCRCNPGIWYCKDCFIDHLDEIKTNESSNN